MLSIKPKLTLDDVNSCFAINFNWNRTGLTIKKHWHILKSNLVVDRASSIFSKGKKLAKELVQN